MKISIVTVVYNRADCIAQTIACVQRQSFPNIEHVVIDGASTDGTLGILQTQLGENAILLSEPDNGIYDALNKGFSLASGDIIGILHSDDQFFDENVIEEIAKWFKDEAVDYVYGDILMVNCEDKLIRYWKSGDLNNGRIVSSQIPHPALFISRRLLKKITPPFDDSYKISADLKQQLYFANKLSAKGVYISKPLAKMRIGGASTSNYRAYLKGWIESRRAWNEVHGAGGFLYVIKKVISKLSGLRV